MLEFNEERHEYRLDGNVVPSVTTVLKSLSDFCRIDPAVLEHARQEGVAIHKMVELDAGNDLDIAELPLWMHGYHDAWQKFKADTGFVAIGSEQRVCNKHLGYAGTLDLVGKMRRCKNKYDIAVIDIKRSFAAGPAIGLQLSAYLSAWCANNSNQKATQRFALQLRADGSYRLEPFTDPADFGVFLAFLTIHKFRTKHGLN